MLLVAAINRRYFEQYLTQNSKVNIIRNSISVDMKIYTLKLKQKSGAGTFHGILRKFRTATLETNFVWDASGKKTEVDKGPQWPLWFQLLTFCRAIIY